MLSSTFIDEMGYLPLDDLGATIFFQLVSAATKGAASFSLLIKAMVNGARSLAIRS
jgi:DNA replication protein DnaC